MEARISWRGVVWGTVATLLTAGWWVMGRHGATQSLPPLNMAVLRSAVSGLLLAPTMWRGRALLREASPALLTTLAACGGAPYSMIVAEGLRGATAGNAGALVSGLLPLFGAILSASVFREKIHPCSQPPSHDVASPSGNGAPSGSLFGLATTSLSEGAVVRPSPR